MVHILKGYRSNLVPLTKAPTIRATDTTSLFDLQSEFEFSVWIRICQEEIYILHFSQVF